MQDASCPSQYVEDLISVDITQGWTCVSTDIDAVEGVSTCGHDTVEAAIGGSRVRPELASHIADDGVDTAVAVYVTWGPAFCPLVWRRE